MMKVGIVILNYLVYQDTIAFVESIKQQEQENVALNIVIVDNASHNESATVLRAKYQNDPQIEVVVAPKNLGFANGNNMGYQVLLQYMQPDYVIVANDDILLKEQGLFAWIAKEDAAYQFGVLGPKVYSLKGKCYQSPMPQFSQDAQECKRHLKQLQRNLFKMFWKKPIKKILKRNDENFRASKREDAPWQTRSTEFILHGSFLVFSKRYMDVFVTPFDEKTFLYMEEHILRLRCQKEQSQIAIASCNF